MAGRCLVTPLRDLVNEYLTLRRALGYKLHREGWLLPRFVTFLEARGQTWITTPHAVAWASDPVSATASPAAHRLTMVRRFAEYVRAQDPRTEIPSRDLIPLVTQRQLPYLYTDAEVHALLAACWRLRTRGVRRTTFTLFGLLAATGLRVGEAIALDRADVDQRQRCLIVRHAKFNKSREVPLHATTVEALRLYAQHRDAVHPRPRSPSFFLTVRGTRPLVQNVWQTFARLRRLADLTRTPRTPRIHDLRHSFAMATVLRWSRQGVDIQARLPVLSTYLGHVGPSSTYWYLTATPALLELAAQRVEPWRGGHP
jgi:integrase/recombinase XerD